MLVKTDEDSCDFLQKKNKQKVTFIFLTCRTFRTAHLLLVLLNVTNVLLCSILRSITDVIKKFSWLVDTHFTPNFNYYVSCFLLANIQMQISKRIDNCYRFFLFRVKSVLFQLFCRSVHRVTDCISLRDCKWIKGIYVGE